MNSSYLANLTTYPPDSFLTANPIVLIGMVLIISVMCYLIEPIIFPKRDKRRKRKWKMQN
jgi:hypothetical protein